MQTLISTNIYKRIKEALSERVSNPFGTNRSDKADYDYPDANLQFLKRMNIEF